MSQKPKAKKIITNPATLSKLADIQSRLRQATETGYHEYYRVVTDRGFTKITLPKKRPSVA